MLEALGSTVALLIMVLDCGMLECPQGTIAQARFG